MTSNCVAISPEGGLIVKPQIYAAILMIALFPLANQADAARDPAAPTRNSVASANSSGALHGVAAPNGTGLAPTTWGFAAKYSGTLYGSGYYPFDVDYTYGGANSVSGYSFNYPSFMSDTRSVYLFDISGLAGQPSPVWSAYMFDIRQPPTAGTAGTIAFAQLSLEQAGANYSLQGVAYQEDSGNARDVDVYDAEDFENATPFNTPEAAYTGNNTQIGTFALPDSTATPFNVDVTAAVGADGGGGQPLAPAMELPTLDPKALAAIALLLLGGGLLAIRRRA